MNMDTSSHTSSSHPHTLVIGGTRGLGWALARHALAQGHRVSVCGRDPSVLSEADRAAYPLLHVAALDVADAAAVQAWVAQLPAFQTVIVTAGQYFNTRHQVLDEAATWRLLQTNVTGLAHVLDAVTPRLLAAPQTSLRGQVVVLSSVAGLLHDYPGASLYSATKRSVLSLCDTYRRALAPLGIHVLAVAPGYIDTAQLRALNGGDTQGKPWLVSEDEAVRRITTAMRKRLALCVFPWQMRWAVAVLNHLPLWPLLRWLWPSHRPSA
jgi:NAD(P)-dependent dehydrogenase (short-subunit alcohol dehydrogenase family)